MTNFKLTVVSALFLLITNVEVFGQNDSAYYVTHDDQIHGRIYAIKKYTVLNYQNKRDDYSFRYLSNTSIGLGVGVTYSWLTVNIAYGLRFVDPNTKGKTNNLDLQIHGYGKKFILDTFGQFYKGFYLSPGGKNSFSDQYYYRPDLKMNVIGASFQYIVNNKRFSFRSSFLQSDWQKKSAGSVLVGIEAYGGNIQSDSTITPTLVMEKETIQGETRNEYFQIGPTGGYAYTWVLKKHFFLTGSAAAGITYGFKTVTSAGGNVRTSGFSPNTSFRVIAGYNSEKWGLSLLFINNDIRLAASNDHRLTVKSGAFRVNYVHRFDVIAKKQKKHRS